MGLWKAIRSRLYRPVVIESWQRGLLVLNGRVSRPLEPGVHRVWYRPDLHIDIRVWDTRQSVLTGLEPELESSLPRNWLRAVDVAPGQVALVYHYGVPTAYLPPGHHLVWTLDRPPEVRTFDTAADPLPPLTPELKRLLPADAYIFGTVPEDHVGLLFRDRVCVQILPSGQYGLWQGRSQLGVQLQNVRQTPLFPAMYQTLLGEDAEVLDIEPHEALLVWFDGKPAHWLAQTGRHLLWKTGRTLRLERFDLRQSAPELSRAQKEVIPGAEYLEIRVGAGEIGILVSPKESRKPQALGPGRSTVWTRGEALQLLRVNPLQDPVLRPEHLDIVPEDWTLGVEVAHHELAVVRIGGRPVRVLGEGSWRVWAPANALGTAGSRNLLHVEIERVDSRQSAPDPKAPWFALLPAGSFAAANVGQGQVGILRRAGRVEGLIEPGEHLFWNLEKNVSVQVLDLRPQALQVNSQEMLTKDKVSLRLNLAVVWKIAEPLVAVERMQSPGDLLYLRLQLAARRFVSSRNLDELLEGRDELERLLKASLTEQVVGTGVVVEEVGLKDLILPGTMRSILNRVVEAQRKAEANNILRREETAATRSLANTARVLANNPVLLRLKELEHIKEIADRIGQVNLIVSSKELGTLMGFPGMTPLAQLGAATPEAAPEEEAQ
jgi:regulator of protease activity HflC (stomatin/prohibitin superfamily)